MKTLNILAADITPAHAIVAPSGAVLTIDGDVEESSVRPGIIRIETEAGALYLGDDEEVAVIDGDYVKAGSLLGSLIAGVVVGGSYLSPVISVEDLGESVRIVTGSCAVECEKETSVISVAA